MITYLLNLMWNRVTEWHAKSLTWFNLDDHFVKEDTLEYLVTRVIFHNYCGWHLIEGYRDPDTDKVNFVYLGGLEQNQLRNEAIELMDEKFRVMQKGTGVFNSETLGSIIDRISILYIKMLHMLETGDQRFQHVLSQTQTLERCAKELLEEMKTGTRQVEILSRFKTSGYNF